MNHDLKTKTAMTIAADAPLETLAHMVQPPPMVWWLDNPSCWSRQLSFLVFHACLTQPGLTGLTLHKLYTQKSPAFYRPRFLLMTVFLQ